MNRFTEMIRTFLREKGSERTVEVSVFDYSLSEVRTKKTAQHYTATREINVVTGK